MALKVFVDTNFFLQSKDIASLPWADLFNDDELCVLVPRTLIGRAREYVQYLANDLVICAGSSVDDGALPRELGGKLRNIRGLDSRTTSVSPSAVITLRRSEAVFRARLDRLPLPSCLSRSISRLSF